MEREQPGKPSVSLLSAYDWLESVASAIVACILIFLFVARVVNVDGSSMVPTLHNRDKIIITRLYKSPEPGDIVVLTKQSYSETSIVKRVIATEGQTVDIDFATGTVKVDGEVQNEPYIAEITHNPGDLSYPLTVKEGCLFCMGDNRNHSTDSRYSSIGQIDKRCVLGKVLLRIWPFSGFGGLRYG